MGLQGILGHLIPLISNPTSIQLGNHLDHTCRQALVVSSNYFLKALYPKLTGISLGKMNDQYLSSLFSQGFNHCFPRQLSPLQVV